MKSSSLNKLRNEINSITNVKHNSGGRGGFVTTDGLTKNGSAKRKFLKGLTPLLKKCFWPDYEYIESKYKVVGESGLNSPGDGMKRGTLVHSQLEDYGNKTSTKQFASSNPILHPYTKKAIQFMREFSLKPLFAEFPVGDNSKKVGTALDMVVVDTQENIKILEWKTGLNNYILRASGNMKGPRFLKETYSNSPLNQAFVQLLFSVIFFEQTTGRTVGNSSNGDFAYVVNINEEGVVYYKLPSDLWENRHVLYNHLLDHIKTKENKKKYGSGSSSKSEGGGSVKSKKINKNQKKINKNQKKRYKQKKSVIRNNKSRLF